VAQELYLTFRAYDLSFENIDLAVQTAYQAQEDFERKKKNEGLRAVAALERENEPGMVLVGRSYLLYQREINCDLPRKFRSRYGANLIPADFLPGHDCQRSLSWSDNVTIMQAAETVGRHPELHLILFASTFCGPDRVISLQNLVNKTRGRFLRLELGGHQQDAGYLTRFEAYLAGQGVLRTNKLGGGKG
jgi:predicted nucleotide-binding protein (sugar kinase/HSP70/actin superfamily)